MQQQQRAKKKNLTLCLASDSSPSSSSSSSSSSSRSPIGVHALVFAGGWSEADIVRCVTGAKTTGYDLVEVPLLDPSSVDAELTKRILEDHGMRATSSLGLSFDKDIASEDEECVRRGEALLNDAVDATAGFGGNVMCGVIYSALGKYPGKMSNLARKNCVNALRRVANRAADKGITLGLECVNRYETNVLNTSRQACEMCSDVGTSNIKVHLDSYHMNIEEASMRQAIADAGSYLGYVHVGEAHRGYLGTGMCDLDGLFDGLKEVGYDGPVTFESFSSAIVSKDLSDVLCVWRDMWNDSHDLATNAREFIRQRYH